MRELLIPYAISVDDGSTVSAVDIANLMADIRSTVRLQATARHDTSVRRMLGFECPACAGPIYPRAPARPGLRYYWSHLPRGSASCPLEGKRKLTPDEINARIFQGRQEGPAHKNLVELLVRLAERDPNVGIVRRGEYLPPTDDMRDRFPYGRFPDVQFHCGGTEIVLEAQLATITLHGINGRRAFYDRKGCALLWVMRNLDPRGAMQASVRDIVADQCGQLFSIDQDLAAWSERDGIFRLRCWTFAGEDREEPWISRIVTIVEAAKLARPVRWCDEFKRRWIDAYAGSTHGSAGTPDPYDMLNEVAERADLPPYGRSFEGFCILRLIGLLISLEAGVVTGSGHSQLISLANTFDACGGHRAVLLVCAAIRHWQPHLMDRRSMNSAIGRAKNKLQSESSPPWRRSSPIGRIRDVLFPDWTLPDQAGGTSFAPDRKEMEKVGERRALAK